jgi:predicted DNA-binding transcriptional regulator YafY
LTLEAIAEETLPRRAQNETVLNTSARLLRLLSMLTVKPDWTGPELAARLEVSSRTVRSDIDRLRSLGYPVEAVSGVGGGYRLGAGAALPPLLLDDDEALAVAVGLRTAAGGLAGFAESAERALTKLEQVLPSRLRHRLATLQTTTAVLPEPAPVEVPAETLTAVATAIRDREQLRFDYANASGTPSRRTAEPHLLVHTRGRWYLAAWEPRRDGWRTFRLDRMTLRIPNGPRFPPRPEPDGGLAGFVEHAIGTAPWRVRARAVVSAPAAAIIARVPSVVLVEELDAEHCAVHVGSDTPEDLAMWLGMLGADFVIDGPPEMAAVFETMRRRYARAAQALVPLG